MQKSAEAIVDGKEAVIVKAEAFINIEGLNVRIRRRQQEPIIKVPNNRKHICTTYMRISRKLKVDCKSVEPGDMVTDETVLQEKKMEEHVGGNT